MSFPDSLSTLAPSPGKLVIPFDEAARLSNVPTSEEKEALTMISSGAYQSSTLVSGSAVTLTTATPANVTSVSLGEGDWDITGVVDLVLTGATASALKAGVSNISATFGAQDSFANIPVGFAALSATYGLVVPVVRIPLGSTTIIYLVVQATFTVGTVTAYGTIRATRQGS